MKRVEVVVDEVFKDERDGLTLKESLRGRGGAGGRCPIKPERCSGTAGGFGVVPFLGGGNTQS